MIVDCSGSKGDKLNSYNYLFAHQLALAAQRLTAHDGEGFDAPTVMRGAASNETDCAIAFCLNPPEATPTRLRASRYKAASEDHFGDV